MTLKYLSIDRVVGQLMYLTGMVDKRTLEKYEKEAKDKGRESWYSILKVYWKLHLIQVSFVVYGHQ